MRLVTSGLVPPNAPPLGLPAELIKFLMLSPFVEVEIPTVSKAGAAVALANSVNSGSGAIVTVVAMRAATMARADWETKVFNT